MRSYNGEMWLPVDLVCVVHAFADEKLPFLVSGEIERTRLEY